MYHAVPFDLLEVGWVDPHKLVDTVKELDEDWRLLRIGFFAVGMAEVEWMSK
jgi:hypothetical protein